MIQLEKCSTYA